MPSMSPRTQQFQAAQGMSTAFKAASGLSRVTPENNDIHNLLIRLKHRDMTEPVEAVVTDAEIIH